MCAIFCYTWHSASKHSMMHVFEVQALSLRHIHKVQSCITATLMTLHALLQVSSIRQGQRSSSAAASTSHSASPHSQQSQVELKQSHNSKSTVTADMVLWTAGSSPASKDARALNLPFGTNPKGATLTDKNLQVLKQPRVFALGDVAGSEIEAETAHLAPTAQVRHYRNLLQHFLDIACS